jgi:hypothetical protein
MSVPNSSHRSEAGPIHQGTLFPALPPAAPTDPPPAYPHDICANRHGGAETSAEAHDRVKPFKRGIYARILALVRASPEGATVHELAEALGGTYPSSISGRLTELRVLGRLTYATDANRNKVKRCGACALVLTTAEQQAPS